MARATLLRHAREVLVIAERIDITRGETIGSPVIEAAADRWAREQHHRHRVQGLKWSRALFVQTATNGFHLWGRLEAPHPGSYLLQTGLPTLLLTSATSAACRPSPSALRAGMWRSSWAGWASRIILSTMFPWKMWVRFLANNGKRGWGRISVSSSAKALRAFFRHAATRGWCVASIAAGIDGPRLFQHEGLPVGPPWPDVQRLIASTGGDSARDIRDRAIPMLLATYGFRSGAVAGLCLEDVNWESEIVAVSRPKQRRAQEYPLVSEVGEAIVRYLQQVRPRCARREIFLTLKAPFRRLSQGAPYHLVSTRLDALGIQIPRRGPHSLRLARAGVTVQVVRAAASIPQAAPRP